MFRCQDLLCYSQPTRQAGRAKADIVPVAIANWGGYPKLKPFKRSTVELHIGKPISYELPEDEIISQWCDHITKYADYTNSMKEKETVNV